jgi:NADPH:quinone reductase-like Zn-dependent oxidoreductase
MKAYCLFCFGQAYYAVEIVGHMKKGESVLIHSGVGGVGQAAINICLHTGCTVYTTVDTEDKRNFVKKQFPQVFGHPISPLNHVSVISTLMPFMTLSE